MPDNAYQSLGADGETKSVLVGGPVRLSLTGDFGGGTAQVKAKAPDGSLKDVANGSFTAVTDSIFDFPPDSGTELIVDLTGSTNPDLVIWWQASGF